MKFSKKHLFLALAILAVFLTLTPRDTPPQDVKVVLLQSLRSRQVTVSRSSGVFAGQFENQPGREKWSAILEKGRIETERIVPGVKEGEIKYSTDDTSVVLIFYPGTYSDKGPYVVAYVSGKISGSLVLEVARGRWDG